ALAGIISTLSDLNPQPTRACGFGGALCLRLAEATLASDLAIGDAGAAQVLVHDPRDAEQHDLGGGVVYADPKAGDGQLPWRQAREGIFVVPDAAVRRLAWGARILGAIVRREHPAGWVAGVPQGSVVRPVGLEAGKLGLGPPVVDGIR